MDQNGQEARLANIVFWVRSLEDSRRFFATIGLEPVFERENAFAAYGSGDTFGFSIFQADGEVPTHEGWARCPNDRTLNDTWAPYYSIYVADVNAATERCRAAGIPMRQEEPYTLNGGRRCLEVQDPDGRTWAIIE